MFGSCCWSASSCPCKSSSRQLRFPIVRVITLSLFQRFASIHPPNVDRAAAGPVLPHPQLLHMDRAPNHLYNTATARLPSEHPESTTSVPQWYLKSTTSVPRAYLKNTTSVPRAYLESTSSVPRPYQQRTCTVPYRKYFNFFLTGTVCTVEPPIMDPLNSGPPPNNGPPLDVPTAIPVDAVIFCSRIADNLRIPNNGQVLRTK